MTGQDWKKHNFSDFHALNAVQTPGLTLGLLQACCLKSNTPCLHLWWNESTLSRRGGPAFLQFRAKSHTRRPWISVTIFVTLIQFSEIDCNSTVWTSKWPHIQYCLVHLSAYSAYLNPSRPDICSAYPRCQYRSPDVFSILGTAGGHLFRA